MVKILLAQIRYERNITLRKLKRLTGVSVSALSRIENEQSNPSIQVLCRIANGLDLCVTDLFIDTEYEKRRDIKQRSKCDTCICYRTFLKYDAMKRLSDKDPLQEF